MGGFVGGGEWTGVSAAVRGRPHGRLRHCLGREGSGPCSSGGSWMRREKGLRQRRRGLLQSRLTEPSAVACAASGEPRPERPGWSSVLYAHRL